MVRSSFQWRYVQQTAQLSVFLVHDYTIFSHIYFPCYPTEMEAVDMYDCGVDANEEQQEQQEDQYDENLYTYEWYSYELSQEQAEDASEVCQVVTGMGGTSKTKTVYDKQNGGSMYNYKKQWSASGNGGMGTGAVVSLVILLVVVAGALVAFMVNKKKGDEKKTPLINNADGTMA